MKFKTEFDNLIEDIEQSIEVILLTQKGEKIFEPEFGCDVWSLLDSNIEKTPLIIASIYDALDKWEKRIKVEKVNIKSIDSNTGSINLEISYTIKETGERNVFQRQLQRN